MVAPISDFREYPIAYKSNWSHTIYMRLSEIEDSQHIYVFFHLINNVIYDVKAVNVVANMILCHINLLRTI